MRFGFHVENLYGVRVRTGNVYDEDTLASSNEWAIRRCEELKAQGIEARIMRTRKREPLCVVYRLTPETSRIVGIH
jgi:hypothetical protein